MEVQFKVTVLLLTVKWSGKAVGSPKGLGLECLCVFSV
jgi:hypothetical protein